MKPLSTFIFIIPIIETQKSASGLSTANSQLKKGVVFSSADPKFIKDSVVLYKDGSGLPYEHEGNKGLFFNLKHEEIICIL